MNRVNEEVISDRGEYSKKRLAKLSESIGQCPEIRANANLSLYVTGSYGRLEASERSDLDVFFVADDTDGKIATSTIDQILIAAFMIKLAEEHGFPEFSNDGQYLEIHPLTKILQSLGAPADDFENYFTARLLLLLEGRPIGNESACGDVLNGVIQSYFRDYHDHTEEFRPVFLVNDILRFWKTLCLNYEHRRNRPADDEEAKGHAHLKNLKLKFSRLLTCYSMILPLTAEERISPERVKVLCSQPPLDRVMQVARDAGAESLLERIVESYSWFLDFSAASDAAAQMRDKSIRAEAFRKGDDFGSAIYELLQSAGRPSALRYLTV